MDFEQLAQAAVDEDVLVEYLKKHGLDAGRTEGGAKDNRKYGDVWCNLGDRTVSIELQISPGEGKAKNFSLTESKIAEFVGHDDDIGSCYYLLGNKGNNAFAVIEKSVLDGKIDERDDTLVIEKRGYFIVKTYPLAAAKLCTVAKNSLEECCDAFAEHLSQLQTKQKEE